MSGHNILKVEFYGTALLLDADRVLMPVIQINGL
jgi:hypothetical protein